VKILIIKVLQKLKLYIIIIKVMQELKEGGENMYKYTSLKTCLSATHISQTEIADLFNLKAAIISQWCNKKTPIPENKINTLCEYLRIERNLLVDENRFVHTDISILDRIIAYYDHLAVEDKKNGNIRDNTANDIIQLQIEVEAKRKKCINDLRKLIKADTFVNGDLKRLEATKSTENIVLRVIDLLDSEIITANGWDIILSSVERLSQFDTSLFDENHTIIDDNRKIMDKADISSIIRKYRK